MTFLLNIFLCIISFILGFLFKSLIFKFIKYLKSKRDADNHKKTDDNTKDESSEEEEIDFENEDIKMVFLVREDLKLGAGKIAAQVAHAAVGLYEKISTKGKSYYKNALNHWKEFGAKKIVLRCKDLNDIKHTHHECKTFKIPSIMISDAGHTQVDPGTITVLGIGPEISDKLNKITGNFKLMR